MATESIHTEGVRHETRDASIPALAVFGGVIVLTIAAVFFFSSILFGVYKRILPMGPPPTPFQSERQLPPEPRLQLAPHLDLENYIDAQQSEVNSYGWVNRRDGVVHIPIARAMQLLLAQGLPVENTSQTAYTEGGSAPQRKGNVVSNPSIERSSESPRVHRRK